MTRGILRISFSQRGSTVQNWRLYYSKAKNLTCGGKRSFSTSNCLRKEKIQQEPISGIPYKNLTVGVPKEVWKNEKRYKSLSPSA